MSRIAFLVLELGRFRLAFPLWVLEEVFAFLLGAVLLVRGRPGRAVSLWLRPRLGLSAYQKGEEVLFVSGLRVWVWRPF